MFQKSIISEELSLYNFFEKLKLDLYLTKPQISHLENIMNATLSKGYNGKVSDVASSTSQRHRTSITRFLSSNAWNEEHVRRSLKSLVLELIWEKSRVTKKPIYFIIDDTISEKTKPSSKAVNPIEKCGFHNSHLKGKNVYGHQIVVSLLSCDGLVLPYSIDIYDKNTMSKIKLAECLIKSLPKPIDKGYVLGDSWYSCKAIFKASALAGYAYIGALKTNRVIFPSNCNSLGVKLNNFAKTIDVEDFNLVTVKNQQYYIYNYVGNLKDMKNISITLSYPKESLKEDGSLKAFISLDTDLKPLDILTQYTDRWAIELFFRDCKTYLGLNGYQVRSEKSINRFLLIILLNYTYCKLYSREAQHFNTGYKEAQKNLEKEKVIFIFNAATNGETLEKVLEYLNVA